MNHPHTTADAVRSELEVSPDDYPSIEDRDVAYPADRWVDRAHSLTKNVGAHPSEREELELILACHFATVEMYDKEKFERGNAPEGVVTPYWTRAVSSFPAFRELYYSNGSE